MTTKIDVLLDRELAIARQALEGTPMESHWFELEKFVRQIVTVIELESSDYRLIEGNE